MTNTFMNKVDENNFMHQLINTHKVIFVLWLYSSVGRMLVYGTNGQGFDPLYSLIVISLLIESKLLNNFKKQLRITIFDLFWLRW